MQPKNPPTEFARAVRAARVDAGLSQAELSARLRVAPSTVYRVERGESPGPVVETKLRRWCRDLPAVDAVDALKPTGTG